jgi:hypothetical protein
VARIRSRIFRSQQRNSSHFTVKNMPIAFAFRPFIAAAFAIGVCGQAYSLTVYDVIQLSGKNYGDQDIVTLIKVTDSAFELKAEDIPRLMDLGVSETMIQAMLKATHLETPSDSPAALEQGEPNAAVTTGRSDTTEEVAEQAGNTSVQIEWNQNAAQADVPQVSLEDILLLIERGISNETVLVFLETRDIGFILDAEDIDKLLAAGVSEEVISYLLQQTATYSVPSYSYRTTTYVDRYPSYYYTPYYSATSVFLGFSSFPRAWFRHHHSGVHHGPLHHDGVHHPAHNDRGALSHAVPRGGHGGVHVPRHGLGHNDPIGIEARGVRSTGRIAGHSLRSSGRHIGEKQSVGHRTLRLGVIGGKSATHRGRHTAQHGNRHSAGHSSRSVAYRGGHSGGHGTGHRGGHGSGHGGWH